jgi:hypothetical protein
MTTIALNLAPFGSGLAFCCIDLNFEASEMKYESSILCLIGFDGWE